MESCSNGFVDPEEDLGVEWAQENAESVRSAGHRESIIGGREERWGQGKAGNSPGHREGFENVEILGTERYQQGDRTKERV